MRRQKSAVAKNAGIVKTPIAAPSAKQLREHPQQSSAEEALIRAANDTERISSAQALCALAGLIPKGSGLPADLSKRHTHYTWDE